MPTWTCDDLTICKPANLADAAVMFAIFGDSINHMMHVVAVCICQMTSSILTMPRCIVDFYGLFLHMSHHVKWLCLCAAVCELSGVCLWAARCASLKVRCSFRFNYDATYRWHVALIVLGLYGNSSGVQGLRFLLSLGFGPGSGYGFGFEYVGKLI